MTPKFSEHHETSKSKQIIILLSYCSDFSHLLLQLLANPILGIFTKTKIVCVSEPKSLPTNQTLQTTKRTQLQCSSPSSWGSTRVTNRKAIITRLFLVLANVRTCSLPHSPVFLYEILTDFTADFSGDFLEKLSWHAPYWNRLSRLFWL